MRVDTYGIEAVNGLRMAESPGKLTRTAAQRFLARTIDSRGFRLAYQPIYEIDRHRAVGVEALCRFSDGSDPQRRFEQAERLGLAAELDLAIIEAVLDDLSQLRHGYVAINLSPLTLRDPALHRALLAPEVPAERIVIELTEHAHVEDYEPWIANLLRLRESGIRLAIDDVGAGYAAFRHILDLRPDIIKMDRSITHGIDTDNARQALAAMLVTFAGELQATVVAEGVETDHELVAVRDAGIRCAQGYLLARPSPLP